MGLAQDLLEQANHLANREPKRPRQASLRRAVSTAYYALFHLLVADAISHWNKPQQRAQMARGFEHTAMKDASKKIAGKDFRNSDPGMVGHLRTVAAAFVNMQQFRHAADYSHATKWAKTEVQDHIATVTEAFASWRIVRNEKVALDYLMSLLVKERKD
jgi:uncharacterized protein (UPF0332 family)